MKIESKINLPLFIEISHVNEKQNLIKNFSSIQDNYNFFIEQYKTFDENDKYYTVATFNDVEFSDSNQELDYLKHAIDAMDRGVQAYIIYIYDENTLPVAWQDILQLKQYLLTVGLKLFKQKTIIFDRD